MDLPLDQANFTWTDFQDFVRELFACFRSVRRSRSYGAPGDAQGGIDVLVEWDDGTETGVQVKQEATFGPADLKTAVAKATYPAHRFVLALSREATVRLRTEEKQHPKWEVWDKKDIAAKVRSLPADKQRELLTPFFGNEFTTRFLGFRPPSPYETIRDHFGPLMSRTRLFHHSWALVGRDDRVKELDGWLASEQRIFILPARGGTGKTKLVEEWGQRVETTGERAVRFLSSKTPVTPENVTEHPLSPCVIIVDDAHSASELPIFLRHAILRPNVKIVLSTRPHATSYLRDLAVRCGFEVGMITAVKELEDLDQDAHLALAKEALGPKYEGLARELVRVTRDSPLMTTIGGQLIARDGISPGQLTNDEEFRTTVLSKFTDEALVKISNRFDARQIRETLDLLSLIGSFRPERAEEMAAVSEFLRLEPHDVAAIIDELESAGVLVRRGNYVRIVPDVLSDHLARKRTLTSQGRPTGFGDLVLKKFWSTHRGSILRTLAQIDWETAQGGTGLLDAAWTAILTEYKEGDTATRASTLADLRGVAIFQPERAFDFLSEVIPLTPREANDPYSRTLGDAINELLGELAHHPNLVQKSVKLLWGFAKGDERPPPQSPGHALRILEDIAKYGIRKPVVFQHEFLKAVLELAKDTKHDHRTPPLIAILKPLIQKEDHDTFFDAGMITTRPFLVNPAVVVPIVRGALDIVRTFMPRLPAPARAAALDVISEAMNPVRPLGEDASPETKQGWLATRSEALKDMTKIASQDPSLSIRLHALERIRWHASTTYQDEIGKEARTFLDQYQADLRLQVLHVLVHHWDARGPVDYEGEKRLEYEVSMEGCRALVGELKLLTKTPEEFAREVFALLDDVQQTGKNSAPAFFTSVASEDPEIAEAILTEFLRGGRAWLGSNMIPAALVKLRSADPNRAPAIAKMICEVGDAHLTTSVLEAYSRLPAGTQLTPEEDRLLNELARGDEQVKSAVMRVRVSLAPEDTEATAATALSFEIGSSTEHAAQILKALQYKRDVEIAELSDATIDRFLEKLKPLPNLRPWEITNFLTKIAERDPVKIARFLIERIERSANEQYPYDSMPESHADRIFPKGVPDEAQRMNLLRALRDLPPQADRYAAATLFKELSNDYRSDSLLVLLERVDTAEAVKGVVRLFDEAPAQLYFDEPAFLSQLFSACERIDQHLLKSVTAQLARLPFRGGSRAIGVPDAAAVAIRDQAKVSARATVDPQMKHFYDMLEKQAAEHIEFEMRLDQELLDR